MVRCRCGKEAVVRLMTESSQLGDYCIPCAKDALEIYRKPYVRIIGQDHIMPKEEFKQKILKYQNEVF